METKYEVVDLNTGKSHGVYDSLDEARGCVEFDQLTHWSIDDALHGRIVEQHDPGRRQREREADRVDGYDRDDLGESPDY